MHLFELHNKSELFLKRGLIFAVLFFSMLHLFCQKFTAQVSKKNVTVSEVFQLSYSINSGGQNFKAPSFSDFDIYSGPNQSTNIQMINGQVSQSFTITYLLAARKEGKITIGPASIIVGGQKAESNSVVMEVGKGNTNAQSNTQNNNRNNQNQQQSNEAVEASDDEVFVRSSFNKKSCYIGEQILVTHKVYSRHNLKGFQNYKLPPYTGFWSQSADERNKQIPVEVENVNGINYYVAQFSRVYIFPQRTGTLIIDAVELDCIVTKRSTKKSTNIFDQFFGGGYENVAIKLKGKPTKITVLPVPEQNKPDNYNGAVGKFSFKAEIDKDKVKANEGINLKLNISGSGNIKLVEIATLKFPDGIESYEPKVSESVSTTNGVSGSKTYEYLIIPRKQGEYNLGNIGFSYFDPESKQYVSLPSPELIISVSAAAKGSANENAQSYTSNNQKEVADIENDIRYIKTGDLNLKLNEDTFFSSWKHFALLSAVVLFFIAFLFVKKNHALRNSDIVAVRERKAAKKAKSILKSAEVLKNQNKKEEFYSELFVALNGYISEKLNIPIADLSKEHFTNQLLIKNANAVTVDKLNKLMQDCEFARYAPGAASGDLTQLFNECVTVISELENQLKA